MPKVLAGTPCGKVPVCNDFHFCFANLRLPEGSIHQRVIGGNIARNLNELVDSAATQNCSHLFIVEDDSVFEADSVLRLLKHNKPVVTGLCRSRTAPFHPYVYDGITAEGGYTFHPITENDKGLIKVAATGMGGILINMEVFKKLKRPYFSNYFEGEKEWSQDIVFMKSLVDNKIEVYCDLDVIIGHVTQCIIGSEFEDGRWKIVVRIGDAVVNL